VTIAKDIELGDPFANMGAKLIQEVASKTQDNAGDGTSTASILAQSLCHHGLKNMKSGSSPVELKSGFDEAIETVVESLKDRAVPVETSETIKQVATIASNNDEEIPNRRSGRRSGERGSHHRRGGQVNRDLAKCRRGNGIQQGIHEPIHDHRQGEERGSP
jgi:hypothetical protein